MLHFPGTRNALPTETKKCRKQIKDLGSKKLAKHQRLLNSHAEIDKKKTNRTWDTSTCLVKPVFFAHYKKNWKTVGFIEMRSFMWRAAATHELLKLNHLNGRTNPSHIGNWRLVVNMLLTRSECTCNIALSSPRPHASTICCLVNAGNNRHIVPSNH